MLFDRVAAEYDQVAPFFATYGAAIVVSSTRRPEAGSSIWAPAAGR
jgi:hypothetical protein